MRISDVDFLEHPFDVRSFIENFVDMLSGVKTNLNIFTGEAYWAVYDHPDIVNVLKGLSQKGVSIEVNAGPIISKGGAPLSPEIIELTKSNVLKLSFRKTRGNHPHFIMADDRIFEESRHDPLAKLDLRRFALYTMKAPSLFLPTKSMFEKALQDSVNFSLPDEGYLALRQEEIHNLMQATAKLGLEYNNLELKEIKEIHCNDSRKSD